ncbi:MAG: hypothetical protein WC807_00200 [Hyphomicrobium sp.]|jgi:hypothetical protein
MDSLGWLWWLISSVLATAWALFWFLISGWVSTLLQVAVVIAAVYFVKYGWRRAPSEIWRRTSGFARFFWNWVRAREPSAETRVEAREVIRVVRAKEFGDINVSTALSLLVLVGLAMIGVG